MKNALVPDGAEGARMFGGVLISAEPAERPHKLLVAIADRQTPDATLRLRTRDGGVLSLERKPKLGVLIQFEGVATGFATHPFMVTFDVQRSQIKGLEEDR